MPRLVSWVHAQASSPTPSTCAPPLRRTVYTWYRRTSARIHEPAGDSSATGAATRSRSRYQVAVHDARGSLGLPVIRGTFAKALDPGIPGNALYGPEGGPLPPGPSLRPLRLLDADDEQISRVSSAPNQMHA
ncbi:hypothetical protein SAV14893_086410 [Streptomyces avermitilis]|uniref:Uncharacterized protein n=1 Tax=Streptomyces avermitilis TaxID=33903 RepID=A0A4D4N674_STRAX|nr:hypothetical protein SAVMC3_10150 [Streptomyces avermitilis]GDY69248.1 hypothetical protein SAV14893_086410 [Streptomyces avermitilis]GDY79504.1 hypothetical protein SAV31267_089890 [Streptomyces avermitilis]GDY88261.1 hypothetical protein SAVCW2_74600 [Streptomyces avermitilis]